jgi:hypothetical protein
MEGLLQYLERISPGFTSRMRGASEEEVRELQMHFGPIPAVYRAFALAMGRDDAGLGGVARHRTALVRDLYVLSLGPDDPAPRRYLFAFEDLSLACEDYYLDLQQPHGPDDAAVVRIPSGARDARNAFVSLRELLHFHAAATVHLPRFAHGAMFGQRAALDAASASEIHRVFDGLGFARSPYLELCRLYERDDAIGLVHQEPGRAPSWVAIRAHDERELRRICAVMGDRTSLVVSRPRE